MHRHGTFSRGDVAFRSLAPATVAELCRRYDDRVFALNHFTLSHDPQRNLHWFLEQVPDGTRLELDVVCHSRGGLVARLLAERQSDLPLGRRQMNVRRVVFVAAPNAGTVLTDADHMTAFVDTYTNLLQFYPSSRTVDVVDCLITVLKQLAVDTLKGLEGLTSMNPHGACLAAVNQGVAGGTQYFALAANFEPSDPGFKLFVAKHLMGRIFEGPNDLVVPTTGVYDANGSGYFPIGQRHLFEGDDAVHHGNFFENATTQAKLLEWLK